MGGVGVNGGGVGGGWAAATRWHRHSLLANVFCWHWHSLLASWHRHPHSGIRMLASAFWHRQSGIRILASHSRNGILASAFRPSAFLSSARRNHWHVVLARGHWHSITPERTQAVWSHKQGISRRMGRGDAGVLVRMLGGVTRRHILRTSSSPGLAASHLERRPILRRSSVK